MTREEALYWLKARKEHYELYVNCQTVVEALNVAIKALEQELVVAENTTTEPVGNSDKLDCISRTEAMTEIQMNSKRYTISKEFGGMGQVEWSDILISSEEALNILRDLPSVQAKTNISDCRARAKDRALDNEVEQ